MLARLPPSLLPGHSIMHPTSGIQYNLNIALYTRMMHLSPSLPHMDKRSSKKPLSIFHVACSPSRCHPPPRPHLDCSSMKKPLPTFLFTSSPYRKRSTLGEDTSSTTSTVRSSVWRWRWERVRGRATRAAWWGAAPSVAVGRCCARHGVASGHA